MRSTFLAAAAVLACIGGAHAADLPLKAAPMAPPPPTWTGFYLGINGGGAWGSVDPRATDIGPVPDGFFAPANIPAVQAGGSQSFDISGGLAGGQIGYLYQTGPAIFGVEASFDWTDISGSRTNGPTVYPVTPPSTFSWTLNGKSDWLATFTGRIGYNMGSWYPYITGGAAVAHLKYNTTYVDTFYPSTSVNNFSKDALGWVLGAGAEMRVWDRWMLRAEYLHMDFEHVTGNGVIACTAGVGNCAVPANMTNFNFDAHFTEDVVRAALSYRF
jgi:outer membrane immunogenic protein